MNEIAFRAGNHHGPKTGEVRPLADDMLRGADQSRYSCSATVESAGKSIIWPKSRACRAFASGPSCAPANPSCWSGSRRRKPARPRRRVSDPVSPRLARLHALRERRADPAPRDVAARHAREIRDLARDVLRLSPRHSSAEAFLIDKEEVARRMNALARRLETAL